SPDVVDLDHADPGAAVCARHDYGEGARRQSRENARLVRIRGGEPIRTQLSGLGGIIHPVVVENEARSVAVVKIDSGISEDIGYTSLGERRPDTAEREPGRASLVAEDETANHDVVTGL